MRTKFNILAAAILLAAVTAGFGQPSITNQPAIQAVAPGATVTFQVGATGTGPIAYQWQRNLGTGAALHFVLLLAAPVGGAERGTVDGVLAKYVKAIGGKEAWNKVESRSIKAEFEGPGGATSGWSLQAKAPCKRLTRMESSPWGVLLDGFDGTTAWSKNQNDVRTKDGDELSRAEKEADLRREVRLKELYPDLEFKGTETHDGEAVQVLESQPTPSSKERFSFSAKTGFLVRWQSEFKNAEGNHTRVEIRYSEYRAVDGLQYAHLQRIKIVAAGRELEFGMRIKELKHNEKFEDSIFSKPSA